jgi:hypothetical protein
MLNMFSGALNEASICCSFFGSCVRKVYQQKVHLDHHTRTELLICCLCFELQQNPYLLSIIDFLNCTLKYVHL